LSAYGVVARHHADPALHAIPLVRNTAPGDITLLHPSRAAGKEVGSRNSAQGHHIHHLTVADNMVTRRCRRILPQFDFEWRDLTRVDVFPNMLEA
jgi:hypothetical protein